MGLFSKKTCSICGGEIGLFGNRKLEDGNLCKECAAKLSPFFTERRSSTVAEIADQLAYREANKEKVAAFRVTRTLGSDTKILFDEDARLFMVTRSSRWAEANPDVLRFEDVTGCMYEIDEEKTTVQKEIGPASISYTTTQTMNPQTGAQSAAQRFAAQKNPQPQANNNGFGARLAQASGAQQPQAMNSGMRNNVGTQEPQYVTEYEYSYNFNMIIHVNNPYFDSIEFKVNGYSIDDKESMEFATCMNTCEEIKGVLTGIREDVRAAAAPRTAVTCVRCGATTIPDASGRCEYCGGSAL